jgi:hypothetical protein
MPEIKSADEIAKKWTRVASTRTQDYETGVKNPRKDWSAATLAATSSWKTAIAEASSRGSWEAGVEKSGTSKWKNGAVNKGVARWPQGISTAQDAYKTGFAPYAEVISRTTLPARGPKGDPANIERVRVLAAALHDTKLSLLT